MPQKIHWSYRLASILLAGIFLLEPIGTALAVEETAPTEEAQAEAPVDGVSENPPAPQSMMSGGGETGSQNKGTSNTKSFITDEILGV